MRLVLVVLALAACEPPGYGRHVAADAAASDGAHAGDAAPDAPSATTCAHPFRLEGHSQDSSVWLSGDFLGWAGDPAHGAVALSLGTDGAWTGSYTFTAGTFLYKFIIDGTTWIADPSDPDSQPDGDGGENSVYTCTP
ncbi:MAG TPA: hypothetical protein VLX92_10670 [Kofleriaceae bacterium]|nr:hypothetical protein [Kofleriaceae bacterium]